MKNNYNESVEISLPDFNPEVRWGLISNKVGNQRPRACHIIGEGFSLKLRPFQTLFYEVKDGKYVLEVF